MRTVQLIVVLVLLTASGRAAAGDARTGVHAKHGEMVLLRKVDARPAYRPAPPGIALIVDPRPNKEVEIVRQAGELTDNDFALMFGGTASHAAQTTQSSISSLGLSAEGNARVDSGGVAGLGVASHPIGAVGGVTQDVGASVRGALSQLPIGGNAGSRP